MTSADELFRQYVRAFEADERPSSADYLSQVEGQERFALELMIDSYLDQAAPLRSYDEKRLNAEMKTAWAQRALEIMSEPSPADLRIAREEKGISAEELAEKVLKTGGVTDPTPKEKEHAAEYIGRLENGELLRVAGRAWKALTAALEVSIAAPAAASKKPSYGMAFRMEPPPPASPGTEPADSTKAEVFLHAWSIPSKKKWDRVDEFFLDDDE